MTVLVGVGHGLDQALSMLWDTLWALVAGFALSGAVQTFVSRRQMQQVLGDHRPASLARATLFGAASSSCSYAASALAKTLFARGADLTAALVFMVASTNLVVELGVVLWLLIGWQLALAEVVGGAVMVVLLGLVLPQAIPARWVQDARRRLDGPSSATERGGGGGAAPEPAGGLRARLRSRRGWTDAAGYTLGDLRMLRVELVVGFTVAGFAAALVPAAFWRSLFLTGHGLPATLEQVALGPLLALLSFVCSVGNVPLAAALWHGGIGLGGVVSFVFADLLTLPLLATYRRYWGWRITLRILASFWVVMSVAGLVVEELFRAVGIPDPRRPRLVAREGIHPGVTLTLNLLALAVLAGVVVLHRTQHRSAPGSSRFATDPVCGMQVEVALAPARVAGSVFCSDHCAQRFQTGGAGSPNRPAAPAPPAEAAGPAVLDPVCGMSVDPNSPVRSADGHRFCGPGCRDAYEGGRAHAR